MRKFALAFLLFSPLLLACAGGSSRYGCPAERGYSCKSVSEVYAEAASGRKSGERPFLKSLKNEKTCVRPRGEGFLKAESSAREKIRAGGRETERSRSPKKRCPSMFPRPRYASS